MSSNIAKIAPKEIWEQKPLGAICNIIRGVSYKKEQAREEGDDTYLPLLRATNIQGNGLILEDDLVYVPANLVSEEQRLKLGDIVVATSSGSKHLVGKAAQVRSGGWKGSFGAFCAAIRPKVEINHSYLGYFLESPTYKTFIASRALGVNINNLRRGDLEELLVPIAPLPVQCEIVAEIEKQFSRLDEAVAGLKRIKANLKRYKAAVLKAAVEGKLTEEWRKAHPNVETGETLLKHILAERKKKWEEKNPSKKYKEPAAPDTSNLPELPIGWVWATTDQLFSFVTSGSRGWASYYAETGAIFLRMGNLDHYTIQIDVSDIQRVRPPVGTEGSRTRVMSGDILVSITADVGMIGLVPHEFEEAYINQHVALGRPSSTDFCYDYLAWFLACKNGQDQLKKLQRGATKVGLGLDDIRAVNIPLPSFDEQKEIVAEVDRRLSLVHEVEVQVDANLKRAVRLRQTVLAKAFQGN